MVVSEAFDDISEKMIICFRSRWVEIGRDRSRWLEIGREGITHLGFLVFDFRFEKRRGVFVFGPNRS